MSGCKESMYGLITAKVNRRRNYESEVKSLGKKNFLRKPIAYTILLHCINIYIYNITRELSNFASLDHSHTRREGMKRGIVSLDSAEVGGQRRAAPHCTSERVNHAMISSWH